MCLPTSALRPNALGATNSRFGLDYPLRPPSHFARRRIFLPPKRTAVTVFGVPALSNAPNMFPAKTQGPSEAPRNLAETQQQLAHCQGVNASHFPIAAKTCSHSGSPSFHSKCHFSHSVTTATTVNVQPLLPQSNTHHGNRECSHCYHSLIQPLSPHHSAATGTTVALATNATVR